MRDLSTLHVRPTRPGDLIDALQRIHTVHENNTFLYPQEHAEHYQALFERGKYYFRYSDSNPPTNWAEYRNGYPWIQWLTYEFYRENDISFSVYCDGIYRGFIHFNYDGGVKEISRFFFDDGYAHAASARVLSGMGRVMSIVIAENTRSLKLMRRQFKDPPRVENGLIIFEGVF